MHDSSCSQHSNNWNIITTKIKSAHLTCISIILTPKKETPNCSNTVCLVALLNNSGYFQFIRYVRKNSYWEKFKFFYDDLRKNILSNKIYESQRMILNLIPYNLYDRTKHSVVTVICLRTVQTEHQFCRVKLINFINN